MACSGFDTELYDLYALGVLEREDASDIDLHLRTSCATCSEQISESLERTALLALVAPSQAPPKALRSRIIGSVTPARTGVFSFFRSPGLAWAMGAVCAVVGGSLGWFLGAQAFAVDRSPGPVVMLPAPAVPAPLPTRLSPDRPSSDRQAPSPAIAELSRSVANEQSKVAALNGDVESKRNRVALLETELRDKDAQLAAQRREMQVLQASSRPAPPSSLVPKVQEENRQLASAQQRIEELTRQVQLYQTAIHSQRAEIHRDEQLASFLRSPNLRVLELQATEHGGSASGRALLAGNAQIVFYASNLPALPAGRTYQLWLMRNRGPAVVSGGIFQPDRTQQALLTIPQAADTPAITALAVTEEPAGGQPLPTGHKILIGVART